MNKVKDNLSLPLRSHPNMTQDHASSSDVYSVEMTQLLLTTSMRYRINFLKLKFFVLLFHRIDKVGYEMKKLGKS